MPDANPISGPYSAPAYNYTSANAPNTAADYSRTVRVTGSLNNPLTLTGSYANNSGFIVLQPGSLALTFNGHSGSFTAGQFHQAGAAHVIYPIQLTYVSASITGSVLVLYAQ